ncbi:MAG: T9SS type A sorting domain-containing protein [Sphingobacteriales bacterium]|nr:MAG: T9SS type A sorting domain-containing protein [Sphingobacteriales bacterium]
MKKLLLSLTAASLGISAVAQTQTRLSLYEEFSGENCAPCAASNPALWTLLSSNASKAMLIKYQSPIPSAGPIYNLYKTVTDARMTYYSVPFAPYGRLNGTGLGTGTAAPSSPGHVANLTQTDIDNAYGVASPFNISATHAWSTNGDSVTITVNVTANAAYAPTGANMKLRAALVEHLVYATAPGSNGETDFHNVVREMYPNAGGTTVANSWTAGQTMTYTLTGRAPYYVDKNGADTRMVVWFQNDADKSIPQAAKSSPVAVPLDVASSALVTPSSLACAASSTTVTPTVTLKNAGTTPLTSAKIYSRVDAGAWVNQTWTGSLAAGATTNVTLAALTLTPGAHMIYDSVATPNGNVDVNMGNNTSSKSITVYNTTGAALPIATGFENAGALPSGWTLYDVNGNGQGWVVASSSTSNVGHANSKYLLYYPSYAYNKGESNYIILPATTTSGTRSLDFWYAHATYTSAYSDTLELAYSSNCGSTWTSLWSASGTSLATVAATTSSYVPAQADWKLKSINVSNVPAGSLIAFRGGSGNGNNIFLDDINFRTGTPQGVTNVVEDASLSLVPNPATDQTKLTFKLSQKGTVNVQVVDNLGRMVANVVNGTLEAGMQTVMINTATLAAGVYNIVVNTDGSVANQRLTVIK